MDAYRRQRDRFDVKVEGETVLLKGPSDDDSDDEAMVGGTTAFEDLCDGTPRSLRVDADGGGEEQQAQQPTVDNGAPSRPTKVLSKALLRLSPKAKSAPSSAKVTRETGLLEDARVNILLAIDAVFEWVRRGIVFLFHSSYLGLIGFIITVPLALILLLIRAVFRLVNRLRRRDLQKSGGGGGGVVSMPLVGDQKPIRQAVEEAGYPFERYRVVTDDGYLIRLDRLPNRGSERVVYLQHGVFDNSFCWVSTGTQSLAYRLHDLGYDVYLGNLRGTTSSERGQRHIDENLSSKNYWSFCLNEHATYDLPAFFRKISAIKHEEGSGSFRTTVVAHSLGGAATLMYLVFRKMGISLKERKKDLDDWMARNEKEEASPLSGNQSFSDLKFVDGAQDGDYTLADANICGAVCLSPAGVHHEAPKVVYFLAPLIDVVLFLLPVHVFRFPSRALASVVAKLWQDVKQTPTTKYLLGFLVSMLLGGEVDDHPIHSVPAQTVFAGTSVLTYKHFCQIWRADRFQAFDFGPKDNIRIYGTPTPPGMLENYNLIDVPVHFIMGDKDHLIPPSNILKHYSALHDSHPDLAFLDEFRDTGHLEFTVGLRDVHITRLVEIVESCGRGRKQRAEEKE